MFKIRAPQLDQLADEDLIRRIAAYLRERIPESVAKIDPDDLRAVIAHGIEVARGYELSFERSLANFVIDMLAVNPEFHLQPAIHAILTEVDVAEEERLARIVDDVDELAWDEAGAMTDAAVYWDGVIARARAAR